MGYGKRIQEARKRKGLTQKELANMLGLATGTIQQYELEKRRPKADTVEKMSLILSLEPIEILTGRTSEEWERHLDEIIKDAEDSQREVEEYIRRQRIIIGVVSSLVSLGIDEDIGETLIEKMLALNDVGQQKAVERIGELAEIPKYQAKRDGGADLAQDTL